MRKRQRELILVVAVAIAVMSCNNSANIALSFGMVLQTISRDVRRISNRVYRPPVQIPVVDVSLDIVVITHAFGLLVSPKIKSMTWQRRSGFNET